MSRVIKIFNKKRSAISLIFIFLIFSNCGFIESSNYSFYETFINPDVSDLSEEFDNESVKPDLDSVPEGVDIDE